MKNTDKGCDIQKYTIEDKKGKGLPEASFTIIEDYYDNLPDVPLQTDEYYKWVLSEGWAMLTRMPFE